MFPAESLPLVALVVTYNRRVSLQRCLQRALDQDFDFVLVVNNASTDGTADLLREWSSRQARLRILDLPFNGGGAMGFELGLRHLDALLHSRGWVALFDDDAWPGDGCLHQFRQNLSRYQQLELTGVAARVLAPGGDPVEVNRPILNPFRFPLSVLPQTIPEARCARDLYHVPRSWLQIPGEGNSCYSIHAASFVGLFLGLHVLPNEERHRYPQGKLFVYSDDTTFTLNLTLRGHRLAFDPALLFWHDTQRAADVLPWLQPIWKHYYVVRNSFTVNASLTRLLYVPLCLATAISHLWHGTVYFVRQQRVTLLKIVLSGLWDGLRGDFSRTHHEVLEMMHTPSDRTHALRWHRR
jgi:rhamnopyranosyl-N-acetylglucosaminyl-diphospho-decaprenol beta-1,3/1,4-galactofuranosyltransferase